MRLRSEMSKRRPIKATGIAFQGRVGTAHLGKVSQRPAVETHAALSSRPTYPAKFASPFGM